MMRGSTGVTWGWSVNAVARVGLLRCVLAVLVATLCGTTPVIASALTPISQGFLTKSAPPMGTIVSLDKNSTDYVSPATVETGNGILGVVIQGNNSLLTVSDGKTNQVQVATSGVVPVLVSDINGDISAGDEITASPINGVGMKATTNAKVVGVAQNDLKTSSNNQTQAYTDKQGHKHTVLLGQVLVQVNVAYYYRQPDKTIVPQAIQNLANALAGKPVDSLPIIISMAIFIVTIVIIVTIIYSMIHSSIISVGRNPMSQAAIYRNLMQLSALVVATLGVAVVSIYMVLTRF